MSGEIQGDVDVLYRSVSSCAVPAASDVADLRLCLMVLVFPFSILIVVLVASSLVDCLHVPEEKQSKRVK